MTLCNFEVIRFMFITTFFAEGTFICRRKELVVPYIIKTLCICLLYQIWSYHTTALIPPVSTSYTHPVMFPSFKTRG